MWYSTEAGSCSPSHVGYPGDRLSSAIAPWGVLPVVVFAEGIAVIDATCAVGDAAVFIVGLKFALAPDLGVGSESHGHNGDGELGDADHFESGVMMVGRWLFCNCGVSGCRRWNTEVRGAEAKNVVRRTYLVLVFCGGTMGVLVGE